MYKFANSEYFYEMKSLAKKKKNSTTYFMFNKFVSITLFVLENFVYCWIFVFILKKRRMSIWKPRFIQSYNVMYLSYMCMYIYREWMILLVNSFLLLFLAIYWDIFHEIPLRLCKPLLYKPSYIRKSSI